MTVLGMLWELLLCVGATAAFAYLFRAPYRTIPVAVGLAALGWLVFRLVGNGLSSYFLATFVMALGGEAAARLLRKPATLFTNPAVIPLVPGGGLYRTMLHLVTGDNALGMSEGIKTLLAIGLMAMAIGLASFLFKYLQPRKRSIKA